jgi:hypothetical protein
MKLSRSLLALSAIAFSLGAHAAATGSLGGGTGTFLTLSGPGTTGSGGTLSGADTATITGGTVYSADESFAATPVGAIDTFLAAGPPPSNEGPATVTFGTGLKYISFLWGSPDLYNILTVKSSDGTSGSFTVTSLGFGVTDGNQSFSQYVQFVAAAGTTITSLIFNNTPDKNAFEVANFSVTPVPEPETYALILAGLGAMVFITRRRRNNQI